MVCGHLDEACPSPKGTDMKVVGIIYHSRKTRPRLDVWLGGRSCPTNQWTRKVEAYLKTEMESSEVYPYKPFGQAAEAAAAAMQALVSRPVSPLP
jgi:hypothetical protein